uniref:Rieske domain-containing protein n=1 Tax=Chromera velia CCMP2878 TaxID=1169474 RepID=A0A0G4ICJ9_9ALVE|eukprot:Cvel_13146.t1-p1 / transcript=Cvel_13146.t1 / gene=Cvel_13146 / organism=Chromera_velia_CCMP2878 / gene_product=hypothetical protein / transcript_product=hypothetical protein / location=Cvel_scaffold887:27618-28184(-) / protein_length=189 / sequence_SO=supercontig / SO=protein_coding / is_pseudo=false
MTCRLLVLLLLFSCLTLHVRAFQVLLKGARGLIKPLRRVQPAAQSPKAPFSVLSQIAEPAEDIPLSSLTFVCDIAELAEGERRTVEFEGKNVIVLKTGGNFYAVDAKCPQCGQEPPMKMGAVTEKTSEGPCISCALHGSKFSLKDGSVVEGKGGAFGMFAKNVNKPINIHRALVKGTSVYLRRSRRIFL